MECYIKKHDVSQNFVTAKSLRVFPKKKGGPHASFPWIISVISATHILKTFWFFFKNFVWKHPLSRSEMRPTGPLCTETSLFTFWIWSLSPSRASHNTILWFSMSKLSVILSQKSTEIIIISDLTYTKCPQSAIFIYSVGSPCAYRCDKIMMSFMATTDSAEQVLVYQP